MSRCTAICLLLAIAAGGCADRLILVPTVQPIDPGPVQRRMITAGGRQVELLCARSAGASRAQVQAFVLEFCGNATRAEQITRFVAQRWGTRPVEAWVLNYPGYGRSQGPAQLKAIPPAALAAYDEVARHAGDRPIFVAGNSLGTAAALHVAANRRVAGLILQSPPPLQRIILQRFGWWNLWLVAGPAAMQVPRQLDSLVQARAVHAPAVFLLGGRDELVPPGYQRMVVDAYAGPKRVIEMPQAGHNSPVAPEDEQRLQEGLDWLWTSAQPASGDPGG